MKRCTSSAVPERQCHAAMRDYWKGFASSACASVSAMAKWSRRCRVDPGRLRRHSPGKAQLACMLRPSEPAHSAGGVGAMMQNGPRCGPFALLAGFISIAVLVDAGAGADQLPVAEDVVDAVDRRPVLGGFDRFRGEGGDFA